MLLPPNDVSKRAWPGVAITDAIFARIKYIMFWWNVFDPCQRHSKSHRMSVRWYKVRARRKFRSKQIGISSDFVARVQKSSGCETRTRLDATRSSRRLCAFNLVTFFIFPFISANRLHVILPGTTRLFLDITTCLNNIKTPLQILLLSGDDPKHSYP